MLFPWYIKYPNQNDEILNLDWILSTIDNLVNEVANFVTLNTIKYADPIQWNITTQYEKNTVVVDPITGTAYLSSQPVPSGIGLNNTDYWSVIFTLDIISANKNITLRDDANNTLATFESEIGDWLITQGVLYKVIRHIDEGTQYISGYNVERFTVELFMKEYITSLTNYIDDLVGSLSDLTTTDKDSIVDAINELVSVLSDVKEDIGDLQDLATVDKDSIVDAINEVIANCGNLASLNTTDKSSLVNAINEVVSAINEDIVEYGVYINIEHFGAKGDNVTDDTQAFINAFTYASNHPGTVIYLHKKYKITQSITVPQYTKLLGLNSCYDSEHLHDSSNDNYVEEVNSAIWMSGSCTIYLSYGAVIEGVAIFNNQVTYNRYLAPDDSELTGTAISTYVNTGDNRSSGSSTIKNCLIAGFAKGIYWVGSRGLIENCLIDAILGVEVTSCYDILRIKSVHVWPFCGGFEQPIQTASFRNGDGFYFHDGADDTMMSDCFVISHYTCYHVVNTNTIHFASCTCDTSTIGFIVINGNNCMLTNCLFINNTSDFNYVSGSISIEACTFVNSTSAIVIDNTSGTQAVRNALNIIGNLFNNCSQAIRPYNVTYSTILVSGNLFHSCTKVFVGTSVADFVIKNDNIYKNCTTLIEGSRTMPTVALDSPLPMPSPIQESFILSGSGTISGIATKGFDGQLLYIHITGTVVFQTGTNLLVYGSPRTFNNGQTVILLCVGSYWRIVN